MTNGRPVAVLMSGAPGAGKSTLALLLGDVLRLPVVSKDRLREATLWALGTDDIDRAPWGPGLWYPALESLLGAGISVIGDMTLYRGQSEADVAVRLAPLAQLVNVHCRCADPLTRFEARTRADPLRRDDVDALMPEAARLARELYEPLDLDCPRVVVETDDGYQPTLPVLSSRIMSHRPPMRTGPS